MEYMGGSSSDPPQDLPHNACLATLSEAGGEMTFEALTSVIDVWVTQYVAVFCLTTLVMMALGRYLVLRRWDTATRDFGLFLASISSLTFVLLIAPQQGSLLWPPVTWFCFTMLLVMETLWVANFIERIIRALIALPSWLAHRLAPASPKPEPAPGMTPYSREAHR